jgi:hypothetical protein
MPVFANPDPVVFDGVDQVAGRDFARNLHAGTL